MNEHEKPKMEFIAKRVNDMLKKEFDDDALGFFTMVYDQGDSGYLGYLSSTRRVDVIRVIMEWLERVIPNFTCDELEEIITLRKQELEKRDNAKS